MTTASITTGLKGKLSPPLGNLLSGWVWHPDVPLRHWWVEILFEDITLAVVEARLFTPELLRLGVGDGCHAFAFALPDWIWSDTGRISARLANTRYKLPGSYPITKSPSKQRLQPASNLLDGELVVADGGLHLHGWARDLQRPEAQVDIKVQTSGRELAQAKTDSHGRFAIALPLSIADGMEHEISVYANGRPLPGSPVRIFAHRRGARHLMHQLLEQIQQGTPLHALGSQIGMLDRLLHEFETRLPQGAAMDDYATWFDTYETPPSVSEAASSANFLILLKAGEGLDVTIDSLIAQTHTAWSAIVLGGGSNPFDPADPRLSGRREPTLQIDAALNQAHTLVTFIEPGDHLPHWALQKVAKVFEQNEITAAYTDSDQDDHQGRRAHPWLKPAWDLELFLGVDYAHHLFVARTELLTGASIERLTDLPFIAVAALLNRSADAKPWHIPHVLYHRGAHARIGQRIGERRRHKLQETIARLFTEHPPSLLPHPTGDPALRQVVWPLPVSREPKVSILIPTRDRLDLIQPCVEGLLAHTQYPNYEILILDNDSAASATHDWFAALDDHPRCRVLPCPGPFNYSRINNQGAAASEGELICLLNNDTLVLEDSPDWLSDMVARLLRPGVGAVGAKLLWSNHMVQHAGVILGVGGVAAHIGNHWLDSDAGYGGLNLLAHRCSAVTGACLLTHRRLYEEHGGLDEDAFPVNFNDVDYCLRLGRSGWTILWTPFARLYHLESQTRGLDSKSKEKEARARRETSRLQSLWLAQLTSDPCYHPALSLYAREQPFAGLAVPPRDRRPR